jgi:hypothetical protein
VRSSRAEVASASAHSVLFIEVRSTDIYPGENGGPALE